MNDLNLQALLTSQNSYKQNNRGLNSVLMTILVSKKNSKEVKDEGDVLIFSCD